MGIESIPFIIKMKNKTILLTIGILVIGLASALPSNLIAGEPYTFDLNETYEYYSIVGNSTPIDLSITQNGTIVTIILDKYSLADSFELIFFNKEKEIIVEHHHSGGSRTKYINRNITIENKTIEYVNVTIPCNNQTDNFTTTIPTTPTEKNNNSDWSYILIGLVFIIVYTILGKPKNKVKEKENDEK